MRYIPLLSLALVAACVGGTIEDEIPDDYVPPFTPDDPFAELDRIQREGPPRYTSRVHSCAKVRYETLGQVLASRGVAVDNATPLSAGAIYREGLASLGGPNYAQRQRETLELGLATTSKMFDIYVQAAPEIIANMPARPECIYNGVGAQLFDAQNRCIADGISCLIGTSATPQHVAICNQTLASAADIETGKRLAVAVLAAAAHTCE